ncbi:endonuclease/exonuclease/phosphatase family protein [Spirochaeta isovalerica]|uniref:Putative extracellular nuclease n=1 Tax=Spirochaeta isovalerica TaxID=150 RepID=A0A841R9Y3_9SPIO|nr:putative extracellular nuclease [Spirochaeta isovalerica]
MKIKKVLMVLLASLFVLSGCQNPIDLEPPEGTSALVITLNENVSRTLLPDIDMDIAEYRVFGEGPDGESFDVTTSEEVLVLDELAFGDWTVTVTGKNAEGFAIGSGSGEASLHTGETTALSVTVIPFDGFGTLNLTVNWPAGDLEIPTVNAVLTPALGEPVSLDFLISGDSATFSSDAVADGYYSLSLELLDNGINTMGTVEVVRIVKDGVTEGVFDYDEVNQPGGTLDFTIDQQMNNPIEVSILDALDSFGETASMTVSASAPAETENLVYFWFVNGQPYATGESCTVEGLDKGIYNLDLLAFTVDGMRGGSTGVTFRVTELDLSPYMQIHTVQGAGHTSPYAGQTVENLIGVVTAKDSRSFWMQSPVPDNDDATSEGILVYTNPSALEVGDLVVVDGTVKEYGYSNELKLTEITYPTIKEVIQSNYPLPAPVILGLGGRVLPNEIICNDATVDVYDSVFDPEEDGIDFYESIESMLVQINDALVVAGDKYGEIPVLADNGATAPAYTKNARGGVTISADNYNPNLVSIDADAYILGLPAPVANTGDRFSGPVQGVIGYSYGKFLVLPTVLPDLISGTLEPETSDLTGTEEGLTVAAFNVENFPRDDDGMSAAEIQEKIDHTAEIVVDALNSPDILVLEEVTDDSYSVNDGVVSADANFTALVNAIAAAGGPATYDYRQIDPVNNDEGGWTGANIRVGFLFNTARVSFEDIGSGDAVTDTQVLTTDGQADISLSPGRISVDSFAGSRRPLIGKFNFAGETVFVIANHFNSKGGDTTLFGEAQPPVLGSEAERLVQAAAINDFVDQILAVQSDANIVVAGDLNDFQFSAPLQTLKGGVLINLTEELLPAEEQYSYNYNGNSQQLDHILVSPALFNSAAQVDIVHRNSEFSSQTRHSDHDPVLAYVVPGYDGGSGPSGSIEGLIFSDYGEGGSNNKYLEVYNAGTDDVNLDSVFMLLCSNGKALAEGTVNAFPAGWVLSSGELVGVYNSSAVEAITGKMSAESSFNSGATFFNGNDVIVLIEDVNGNGSYEDGTDAVLDAIGIPGDDSYFGSNLGLMRNHDVTTGSSVFDISQWTEYSQADVDAATYYGVY